MENWYANTREAGRAGSSSFPEHIFILVVHEDITTVTIFLCSTGAVGGDGQAATWRSL